MIARMEVPLSLRRWLVAHFVLSAALGLPLLLAPGLLLRALGWPAVDQASSRLAGAALLAIGGQSLIGRDGTVETVESLLRLNMMWSYGAVVALVAAIGAGAPSPTWALLSLLVAFAGVWTHHRVRFRQLAAARDYDDDEVSSPDDPAPPAP